MVALTGGFTLDDTVLLTNEVMRQAPGGNILYSTVAARIWSDDVLVFGSVGKDYPQQYLDLLYEKGIDISYVSRLEQPNIHMWALHEKNNKRQLIYQMESGTNEYMDPDPNKITEPLLNKITSIHIAAIPIDIQRRIIDKVSSESCIITLDTVYIPGVINPKKYENLESLRGITAFLPSIEEVHYIWGQNVDLFKLMYNISKAGVKYVAIKMGAKGSILYDSIEKSYYRIPVFETIVKDTTGAGDAFCGGFVAGLEQTKDPIDAAIKGTVSSSFVIENFGAVHMLDIDNNDVKTRYEYVKKRIEKIGGEVNG